MTDARRAGQATAQDLRVRLELEAIALRLSDARHQVPAAALVDERDREAFAAERADADAVGQERSGRA